MEQADIDEIKKIYPQFERNKFKVFDIGRMITYPGPNIVSDLPSLAQNLELPPQDLSRMKEDFVIKENAVYEMGGNLKLPVIDKRILGYRLGLFLEFEGSIESTYPMTGCYYNQETNMLLPTYVYSDEFYHGNKSLYTKGVTNGVRKIETAITRSIENMWDEIVDYSQKMLSSIKDELTGWADYLFSNNRNRSYVRYLRKYETLRAAPQQQTSILSFNVPGGEKTFNKGTIIDFKYYYPGGEVFGITEQQDTMIVVSDVFIFHAIYKNDTLQKAPNGKMTFSCVLGMDDLKFLSLPEDTPLHLYYQTYSSEHWKDLGIVNQNETKLIDGLGVYALGTPIKTDNVLPIIQTNINKEEKYIDIEVSDNIGLKPNSLNVVYNSLSKEVEEVGYNVYRLSLKNEDILETNTLYITVVDLAGNKATIFKNIDFVSSIHSKKDTNIILYPNPAHTSITLELASVMRVEKVDISDLSGKIIHSQPIIGHKTVIDISRFDKGAYLVKVGNVVKKLIVE